MVAQWTRATTSERRRTDDAAMASLPARRSGWTSTARPAARASRPARCASSSAAAPGSPARRPSAWARGPTATTSSACPTSTATPRCRGRTASPGSPATSTSTASRGRTARGPCSGAQSSGWPAIGYTMKVGVEAEHMLVTRGRTGSLAPFDPSGLDTLDKPCYDFKGLAGSMAYLRDLSDTWRASAGSPTRPTTRTPPPSSSSTGSTPTRSRRPIATRSSR